MGVGTGFVMNQTQNIYSTNGSFLEVVESKLLRIFWCWEGVMHSFSNSLSTIAMIYSLSRKLSFPPTFSK